ncbi:sensor histidine kinase [Streptococcus ovis]|uniref:sensor histidine kinase n=1 Tax=Streptococcus ovis TaxID=82806 RepID=UPI000376D898|nr:ATP-binding protein [Streptococcus ovis]
MSMIYPFLILFVDLLVKWIIFLTISNQTLPRYQSFLIVLGLSLVTLINPPTMLFLEPFYFLILILLFLKPRWTKAQVIFYSFLPFVTVDLYERLSNVYEGMRLVLFDGERAWLLTSAMVIFQLGGLLFGFLLIKILRLNFTTLTGIFHYGIGKRAALILNGSMLFYVLLLHPLLLASGKEQEFELIFGAENAQSTLDLFVLYVYVFIALLIYLNYKAKEYLDNELQRSKDQQLSALSSYSAHVESLYKELRSFRHDYTNVLTSLNEAFKQDDLATAKDIYQAVIAQSDKKFYHSKYDIANLANLTNPAMKSLISAKLMEAQAKGIHLTVEIAEQISEPNMELLDVVAILSIFLDNAIEASQETEDKLLNFAYFAEGDQKILLIENSTLKERVNTKTIYQYGRSSKGDNRGIGLANIKDILAKYPGVSLNTSSGNHRFRQELIFR